MENIKKWTYKYNFSKKLDWLYPLIAVALISNLIIAFAIFLGSSKNFLYSIKELNFVFYMITGIFVFSALLTLLLHREKHTYRYELSESELIIMTGAFTLNHEMQVDTRIGNHVNLSSVTKLTLNRKEKKIKIHAPLTLVTIYAEEKELEEVWSLLCQRCEKAEFFTT